VPVEIHPVGSRQELVEFIELPFRLHSTSKQWVPPLRLERHAYLSRRMNPFFGHGDARYFLARRGDRVVGRISAQIDDNFNSYHGSKWGNFGFLELEDDPEVMAALLGAAEDWLRARGMEVVVGPFDLTMNEEAGILIDGFEHVPSIRTPWHPPYYQRLCEEAGLEKATDLLMWDLEVGQRKNILPIIFDLDKVAREKHGIRIRKMTRRTLRQDLEAFQEVYNAAWSKNWGFTPYSKEDLDAYAWDLQLVFHPDWFMVAETPEGEVAGVAISPLDVNQALKKMNGRLLPAGWWHFLRRQQYIDRVRVGFLGVHPKHQNTGVSASLYIEHYDMAAKGRVYRGELGWILEDNPINKGMEALGGTVIRKLRVYRRELGGTRPADV
jgi:GNAT superfamily N-acetyltransferase